MSETIRLTEDELERLGNADHSVSDTHAVIEKILAERLAAQRAEIVADLRFLADARSDYDHMTIDDIIRTPDKAPFINGEHTGVAWVANIIEGSHDPGGWLPTWRHHQWTDRDARPPLKAKATDV